LLASTISYLMLALCDTQILQISLHELLPCHVWSSSASFLIIGLSYYPITNWCLRRPPLDVQTISSDVARASPQLMSPLVSRVCHRSGFDLFLCGHKSIVACASQLPLSCWTCRLLVGQHSAPYNMAGRIAVL
jgi:hypothetical protein